MIRIGIHSAILLFSLGACASEPVCSRGACLPPPRIVKEPVR